MQPYLRMCMIYMMLMIAGLIVSTGAGCSSTPNPLKQIPPSLVNVSPAQNYNNKIAIVLSQWPSTTIGQQIGKHYVETLIQTIKNESTHLILIDQKSADFPDYFLKMDQVVGSAQRLMAVSKTARLAGYQGWVDVRVAGLRPETKPSGFFWFRKVRHFIFFDLDLTVYDTITGAKIMDSVIESSAKVSEAEYNAFCSDAGQGEKTLKTAIAEVASDQGEKIVEILQKQLWRIPVVQIDSGRIFLSVGSAAGLRIGDRLTVFEGRRTLPGQDGMSFLLPGFKIAQIEIVHVTSQKAEAKDLASSKNTKIQVGDFAAAAVFK